MKIIVSELAERIGAELIGSGELEVEAVGTVDSAGAHEVTFISDSKYALSLKDSAAGAVIVGKRIEGLSKPQLVVKNVNASLIEVQKIFAPKLKRPAKGIDPKACVAKDAIVAESASVAACAVIESGAEIGANTIIGSGCKVGENTKIGENCRLDSNVVVYHNCRIGNNIIIQSNTTIGSVGFGYSFIDGAHRLIPHNGVVVIEDFVEIGSNTCIDRAKFGETRIGAGTKIDNLVQVAHNVVIGRLCLLAGHTGLAGSCKLGDGVVCGGYGGVSDGVKIGDGAIVGPLSAVTTDTEAGKRVLGIPATDAMEALKVVSLSRRLPELFKQVKQLVKRTEKLEASKDDKN